MIARSAIIKPWIFEEIQQRQHIDKSATERLEMLKQFAHWGLEHWVYISLTN
jgi:tRNA-dihydrouridine synthase 3